MDLAQHGAQFSRTSPFNEHDGSILSEMELLNLLFEVAGVPQHEVAYRGPTAQVAAPFRHKGVAGVEVEDAVEVVGRVGGRQLVVVLDRLASPVGKVDRSIGCSTSDQRSREDRDT